MGPFKEGKTALTGKIVFPDGRTEDYEVKFGDIKVCPLGVGEEAKVLISPAKGLDAGQGRGVSFESNLSGGVVGIIFDCRGRQPFVLPEDKAKRIERLKIWNKTMGMYPG